MKKRKPLMKLMTFTLAAVMMMGMSMTVCATENETDGNTEAVCEFATAEKCTKDDCPVHKTDKTVESQAETADKDKTESKDDKDKAESKDTVSGNETESGSDKDKGSEVRKDMDKGDASGEGMTNNTIKNADQAVKTGEVNIIPVIVALAVIAAGAGGAYIIYKKKK